MQPPPSSVRRAGHFCRQGQLTSSTQPSKSSLAVSPYCSIAHWRRGAGNAHLTCLELHACTWLHRSPSPIPNCTPPPLSFISLIQGWVLTYSNQQQGSKVSTLFVWGSLAAPLPHPGHWQTWWLISSSPSRCPTALHADSHFYSENVPLKHFIQSSQFTECGQRLECGVDLVNLYKLLKSH